jgi:hypothetical protein
MCKRKDMGNHIFANSETSFADSTNKKPDKVSSKTLYSVLSCIHAVTVCPMRCLKATPNVL